MRKTGAEIKISLAKKDLEFGDEIKKKGKRISWFLQTEKKVKKSSNK